MDIIKQGDGLPWEIVKVFTKYDAPVLTIKVPGFGDIKPSAPADNLNLADMSVNIIREYQVNNIEQGLEGVRFFHYRQRGAPG